MRKSTAARAALLLTLTLTAGAARAAALNDRPFTDFGSSGEPALQIIFDAVTAAGPGIDVVGDQSAEAVFSAPLDADAIASVVIEIAGYAPDNQLGIYDFGDPTHRALIFEGAAASGTTAELSFHAGGDIYVNGALVSSGFGSDYGFYIHNPEVGFTYYSEDELNPGGGAQALIYRGDGSTVLDLPGHGPELFDSNQLIIAFEDLAVGLGQSDRDFNDMVVHFYSGTRPIPEPNAAALFVAGAAIVGGAVRRKLVSGSQAPPPPRSR